MSTECVVNKAFDSLKPVLMGTDSRKWLGFIIILTEINEFLDGQGRRIEL